MQKVALFSAGLLVLLIVCLKLTTLRLTEPLPKPVLAPLPAVNRITEQTALPSLDGSERMVPFGKEFWREETSSPGATDNQLGTNLPEAKIFEAVERVAHRFQQIDGAHSVTTPTYQTLLTASGFTFNGAEIAARVGHEAPFLDWVVEGNTAQAKRGNIVQHLETRSTGAFLTWVLQQQPRDEIDINVEVRGLAYSGESNYGHHFGDGDGIARMRFGNVTAIDSAGNKWPLATRYEQGRLVTSVPQTVLAHAVYPLAIDPEISPEEGVDSVLAPRTICQDPVVGSNGEGFLVVWVEPTRTGGAQYSADIRATRISKEGVIVDPNSFQISDSSRLNRSKPAVASNGREYKVVWSVLRGGGSDDITAAEVQPTGEVSASYPVVTGIANQYQYNRPALRAGENGYLLVWIDWDRLKARVLGVSPNVIEISPRPLSGRAIPAIAWNGREYAVLWPEFNVIYFRRVAADGTLIDQTAKLIATDGDDDSPKVGLAWSGSEYLAAYRGKAVRLTTDGEVIEPRLDLPDIWDPTVVFFQDHFWILFGGNGTVLATRVTRAGELLDGTGRVLIQDLPRWVTIEGAVSGGSLLVSFQSWNASSPGDPPTWINSFNRLFGTIRGEVFTQMPDTPRVSGRVVAAGSLYEREPAVAPLGEGFLLAWSDRQNAGKLDSDILGARLDSRGTLLDASGFIISEHFNDEIAPRIASLGYQALIVWQGRPERNPGIAGARVVADGTVLDSTPIVFGGSTAPAYSHRDADVAASNDEYLVVWDREETHRVHAVWGSPVNPNSDYPPPELIQISQRDTVLSMGPAVASDGESFLVVWHQPFRNWTPVEGGSAEMPPPPDPRKADIYGVRISGGMVYDQQALVLSAAPGDQIYPAVAFNADRFVVAWQDMRNEAFTRGDIYGTTVSVFGQIEPDRMLATGPAHQHSTALASSSSGFVLTWEELENELSGDSAIHGDYLDDEGNASTAGSFLVNGGDFTRNPAVAARADGSAVIASEGPRGDAYRLLWNTLPAHKWPLLSIDSETQGSWKSTYGGEGYFIAGDQSRPPFYATVNFEGAASWIWQRSATDQGSLERAESPGRVAACWYAGGEFAVRLNLPYGEKHLVAFYLLDWDGARRVQRVEVTHAVSGATFHSAVFEDFSGGKYLVYELEGELLIRFTRLAGPNAVLSGIFFGSTSGAPAQVQPPVIAPNGGHFSAPVEVTMQSATEGASIYYTLDGSAPTTDSTLYSDPFELSSSATVSARALKAGMTASPVTTATFTIQSATPSASATFLGTDAATQGTWQGTYGQSGFGIIEDWISLPEYATLTASGQSSHVWAYNVSDPAALEKYSFAGRIAACWYSPSTFELNLNLSDAQEHRLALYVLDWDSAARVQNIQIFDAATNALLDSREVQSFDDGAYLTWNITGNIRITLTRSTGPNAVLSGIFLD